MFLSLSEGVLIMKTVYFIGILVFLLFTVSSASAQTISLTTVNDPRYSGLIDVEVKYDGTTITVWDNSPGLDGISHIDIKEIGIVLPDNSYAVTGVTDTKGNKWSWSSDYSKGYTESAFGTFNTQVYRNGGTKTEGPITITLNKALPTSLNPNDAGNIFVVHISFGDEENNDAIIGSTWVSTKIPEFSSIAVPVAAVLGLLFISGRKKRIN